MGFQKLPADVLRKHKGVSFPGITTVFFCHDGRGNLLLSKRGRHTRDEQGNWDPGAGSLRLGQTVEGNLRRELKEEYNVEPIQLEFIGYYDVFRTSSDGQPTHWLAMLFLVKIDPSKVKILEPMKIEDYGWFPLHKLPTPMHSQFSKIMGKHGDKLRESMGLQQKGGNKNSKQV